MHDFSLGIVCYACGMHVGALRLIKKGPGTGEVRDQLQYGVA